MRERVMEALTRFAGFQAENEHEARTQSLADAVLAHSRAELELDCRLEHPHD